MLLSTKNGFYLFFTNQAILITYVNILVVGMEEDNLQLKWSF